MSRSFVITGTDTDVGKTVVAAGLVAALGAAYWKPVQAGIEEGSDSETVAALADVGSDRIVPEAYRLRTPCSPHEAARIDGVRIKRSRLVLPLSGHGLIVEGAGGTMVPINDTDLMLNLFADWALPVILVARTVLGTINHSLLSVAALRSRGLDIAGIVFVGEENGASETAITSLGKVLHLGRLPWLEPLTAGTLATAVSQHIRLDLLQ